MKQRNTKAFGNYHPLTLMVYFISVLITAMFTTNPIMLMLALFGGICFCTAIERKNQFLKNLVFYIPLFWLIALTNPIFSHNGATVLFSLNGNPVTLEAIMYGADIAAMLIAVIYWCKCYNEIMTSDKFLYLFGKAVPKLSLVLSMALRFIPQFKAQIKRISRAQKAMGLYSSDNYADKIRSGCRVFTAVISWSLENAVETGNSMKARGYGLNGRSTFNLFRFRTGDALLLCVSLILILITAIGLACKAVDFSFYPRMAEMPAGPTALMTYAAFGLLSFMPFIIELKESLKWNYYISKI